MVYNDRICISKQIKMGRIRAGLTQEELAEKIDISTQQVSRIEVGKYIPSLPTFFKIADVLNLTLKDFGINNVEKRNKTLDNIMKILYTYNETELECCYNILQALDKNFALLNK